MKDLRELVEGSLRYIETTKSRDGYPKRIVGAITGFYDERDAKEFAEENGLILQWIENRDGQKLWYNTGTRFYEGVNLKPEDVDAVYFFRNENEILELLNGINHVQHFDNVEDVEDMISLLKQFSRALNNTEFILEGEAIPFYKGGVIGDEIQVDNVIEWCNDTKHISIAAFDSENL